jgi:hypothetical protein
MAYEFNGTNQWMTTASSPVASTTFTMACWFNSDSITTAQALIHLVRPGGINPYYGLWAVGSVSGDPVQFSAYGAGISAADTTAGYTANTWTHACGVQSSARNRTVYINGGNSATSTANIPVIPTQIRIGRFVDGSNTPAFYLDGRIAEVGIWNADLTAAEVASLAKGITCDKIRPQNLVFYAPLVRDLNDQKGGLTITNNNGATVANHPRVYA